jgi:hypothetical protein
MTSLVLAGNTSGTLTIEAPDSAGTSVLNLPASSGTILDDGSVGVCRAWVNFNGTGTVAIRASFNVSGITDNGTGDYTVNFTNALPDANYAISGFCSAAAATAAFVPYGGANFLQSTTSVRVQTAATSNFDPTVACVSIFR